jgi:hypothetical protein
MWGLPICTSTGREWRYGVSIDTGSLRFTTTTAAVWYLYFCCLHIPVPSLGMLFPVAHALEE